MISSPGISPAVSPGISPAGSPAGSPRNSPKPLYTSVSEILDNSNKDIELSSQKLGELLVKKEDDNKQSLIYNQINLDKFLTQKGFTLTGKIIIDQYKRSDTGDDISGKVVEIVKSMSPNGKTVFISIDEDTDDALYLDYTPSDITMEKLSHSSRFPLSERKGVDEMMGHGISGVVIICQGDICVIKKQNDGNKWETNYLLPDDNRSQDQKQKTETETWISAYPLIKYRDLHSDLNAVNKNIDDATARIRDKERIVCDNNLRRYEESLQKIVKSSNSLLEMIYSRSATLDNNIKIFNQNLDYYHSYPPKTDQDQETYSLSINGIKYTENKIIEILQLCNRLNLPEINDKLDRITSDIDDITNYLMVNPITISFPSQ